MPEAPKTYLRPRIATRLFVEKATSLSLVPKGTAIRGPKTLASANLVPWGPSVAKKKLQGHPHYPLSVDDSNWLKKKYDLTDEEWTSITITTEAGLQSPAGIDAVREFLGAIAVRGLAGAVTLSPRRLRVDDLVRFCIPVRVIQEEELRSARGSIRRAVDLENEADLVAISKAAAGVLLNSWVGREHLHAVLFGEPGEGKTTAVWLYAATEWNLLGGEEHPGKADFQSPRRIPLILPLSAIALGNAPSLVEMAVEFLIRISGVDAPCESVVRKWLTTECQRKNVTLILDGFDELPVGFHEWLRNQLMGLRGLPVLITSRYHADPSAVLRPFRELCMAPLRWTSIDAFIHRYFIGMPGGTRCANELRGRLRGAPNLRQLAQNPLLLASLCAAKESGRSDGFLRTRADVLQGAIHVLLDRGDQKRGHQRRRLLRNTEKFEVLRELAFQFYCQGPRTMEQQETVVALDALKNRIRSAPPENGDALLEEFVTDGLLVRTDYGPFRFLLRRFHEVCLAGRIAQDASLTSKEQFLTRIQGRAEVWDRGPDWSRFRPLNNPRWQDVWALAAGCSGSNSWLVEALAEEWRSNEDLMHSRLRLLAECLGEFLAANHENVRVKERLAPLLSEVVEQVAQRVDEDPIVSVAPEDWRRTLACLPPSLTIACLNQRMRGTSDVKRLNGYVMALGEVGTPEARESLEIASRERRFSAEVKAHIAMALGVVGDEVARGHLLLWLQGKYGKDKYIAMGCIVGLSHVADDLSRSALAEYLRSHANDVDGVVETILRCEHLFGPEIENELLALALRRADRFREGPILMDTRTAEDNHIVEECVRTLRRIGSPSTALALRGLLDLRLSKLVHRQICEAIAEIGDARDREYLRGLVTGKDHSNEAALALLRVGDEGMAEKIVEVATDKGCPEHLREAAVVAASSSRFEQLLDFVRDRLLRDPCDRVRKAAAMGLATRGGPKTTDALRRVLAGRGSNDVRFECARALAMIGDGVGEEELLKALEDDSTLPTVKTAAIQALARTGSPRARETLLAMYKRSDVPEPMRLRCLDGLAQIRRQLGWRPLVRGGWDAP